MDFSNLFGVNNLIGKVGGMAFMITRVLILTARREIIMTS